MLYAQKLTDYVEKVERIRKKNVSWETKELKAKIEFNSKIHFSLYSACIYFTAKGYSYNREVND